jgi:hypothetical protein
MKIADLKNILSNFKKKPEPPAKPASDGRHKHAHAAASQSSSNDTLLKARPSWARVFILYGMALIFCYLAHQFFLWFPPYLKEVFKNLRGLPESWADFGLYWGERGLIWVAILSAVYHNLWQLGTRYRLTSHDIQVENWFPIRRVLSIPYGAARRVGFQQSPLGLALNYGHIEIDTGSSAGPMILHDCPKPKAFLAVLQPKVEAVLQPHLPHRRASDS